MEKFFYPSLALACVLWLSFGGYELFVYKTATKLFNANIQKASEARDFYLTKRDGFRYDSKQFDELGILTSGLSFDYKDCSAILNSWLEKKVAAKTFNPSCFVSLNSATVQMPSSPEARKFFYGCMFAWNEQQFCVKPYGPRK